MLKRHLQLDFTNNLSIQPSRFTEFLLQKNALVNSAFHQWHFRNGMLFKAWNKWWGDRGKRKRPHEGLDVCLYLDRDKKILSLHEKTKIPVLYDGIISNIFNDYLGKTVLICHPFSTNINRQFFSMYGHIHPNDRCHMGKSVKAGEIIGTLAESQKPTSDIIPHLHISLGMTSDTTPLETIDWTQMGDSQRLTLLDPMQVLDGHVATLS